ncbi:hypothetical protein E1176_19105 [Fulvivirga sp. RKSG066]|uniref:hypothetical protein n=1 Tax=Fulvivirga aurantia TaxID=2529383 RepID=UPI0012BC0345|nr:hypothetical protein [Fulvivirga aurantia]MTI23146.1 hypothetical protein [Fulvivirga aurantia]
MRFILTIFLLSFCTLTLAQRGVNILETLDNLNYTAELPKGILASKTLVLVSVPDQMRNGLTVRGDWKKPAEIIQPGFQKAGIDAVAYYHINDIFSGPEAVSAFVKKFDERQLENVAFVTEANGQYRVALTKITNKENLIVAGQDAWKIEGDDLERMGHDIYLKAASSKQDRKNLLIIGVPIYGSMAKVIEARRGEYFDVNFSSETLAIPAFADTAAINQIMADYPYDYVIVDPTLPEKDLRDEGHQYVLYYVHTSAKNVKQILEYPITDTETDYITEVVGETKAESKVKSIDINAPVYKFYVKHIYSENVFLGTKWDADTTWQEALKNYIVNLKNQLIRD